MPLVRLPFCKQIAHQADERLPFLVPAVKLIDLLPTFCYVQGLSGVGGGKHDSLRQFLRIAGLEKQQRVIAEVILDARRTGGDHRLAEREILEDASRRVDVGKGVALVWDDPEIAV